ncbi:hypothetical protein HK405_003635 [Cladochytrium tenue]|nr:hypothetical protein HK405_003635 [Cladochytrium tenue]
MARKVASFLDRDELHFGHTARNLGCQTYACFDHDQVVSALSGLHKRCVLDSMLSEPGVLPTETQGDGSGGRRKFKLGSLAAAAYSGGFLTYAEFALRKMKLDQTLSIERVSALYSSDKYRNSEREIFVLFAVRNVLSQVIECLLLVDRFLFLTEAENGEDDNDVGPTDPLAVVAPPSNMADQAGTQVALVNIFDLKTSPRNMALIATRP